MTYSPTSKYPLRVTLVAVIVGLMGFGMLIAGATSATLLRANLQERVNEQLVQSVRSPQLPGELSGNYGGPGGPGFGPFTDDLYQQVTNSTGQVLEQRGQVADPPVIPRPVPALGTPYETQSRSGSGTWQAITVQISQGQYLTTAKETSDITATVSNLIIFEIVVGGIVTLLAGVAGYWLVRKSLEPLNQVEHAAGLIAQGDLSQRAPDLPPNTEVGSLAQSLNIMLGQVEQSFTAQRDSEQQARESEDRMRQFVADASHELRTPLTSILGYAELNRGRDSQGANAEASDAASNDDVERIEAEAKRMRAIVEDLLLLAKMDQEQQIAFGPVDLLSVTTEAIQSIGGTSPSRSISLSINSDLVPMVNGNQAALYRAVLNLLQNAVNYTPTNTPIDVTVAVDPAASTTTLTVRDYGPGISDADLPRIFERFFRAEKSRSRATGGMGLGLSIVDSIVQNHRGTVTAVRGENTIGMTFTVTLPLVQ